MKIAMLSSFYFPHRGGTERYVRDLSEGLARRGHEVTVFTHTKGHSGIEDGVRVVRVPAVWLSYLPIPLDFLYEELNEFDIINSHIPPSVFPVEIPTAVSVPHVVTYHCDPLIPEYYRGIRIPEFIRGAADSRMRKQAEKALKKADSIIVTSDDYASTSGIVGNFNYTAVPIGVDESEFGRFSSRAEAGGLEPLILYLGRLASGKGIDLLLKAAALLRDEGLRFRVEIVGTGEEEKLLKNLSDKLGLNDTVAFRGALPTDELTVSLNAASALVLPSTSRLEAFGIVQLEAFCARTPVIASSIPGVRQIVRDTDGGWLFPPGNFTALADRMRYVIENPQAATAAGLRGYSSIGSRYNWDVITADIERVYAGCIDRKTAGESCGVDGYAV